MNQYALDIKNLSFKYTDTKVLSDISFFVTRGEIFCIVGPDGAGKTTLIKNCCGLLDQQEGISFIFGMNLAEDKKDKRWIKERIGYLSQRFSLYNDLTVNENIKFFSRIHNVSNFEKRREELLQFMRMEPFGRRLAKNLSGGMKQKLALACTLIHKPDIIFLDEPTTGVDPVSRREFWKILNDLLHEKLTIVMTTPYLDEAERASRIAMINDGKLIACDTSQNIKAGLKNLFYRIESPSARKAAILLQSANGVHSIQRYSNKIHIGIDIDQTTIDEIMENLTEMKTEIKAVNRITPSLEDAFINLVTNKVNE